MAGGAGIVPSTVFQDPHREEYIWYESGTQAQGNVPG